MDSAAGVDTSFSLQDEGAVHTLLSGSEAFVPEVSVAAAADIAWNRKGIQSAVTQGILLGESIPKIAKRMQSVGAQNRAQAVRWARTYTTAAENAGRIASYERAKGMGIKLKQEWLATLDSRTRHSHRQLDGERREVGKRFSNGCRYPGDPQAAYAEICNCRCTLVAAVDGIDQDAADRFSRLPAGTTYDQWKAGKAESAHDSTGRTMGEFVQTPLVRKQLAKRGLTEAQGRKLLSEQLKADGATGHQFRTMTKQQQRKTWNSVMRGVDFGSLGGSIPKGMADTPQKRDLARKMAQELNSCKDENLKALFKKYGQEFTVKNEKHVAYYSPAERRVVMGIKDAVDGGKNYLPMQTVFHEFGHMVDGISASAGNFSSAGSKIVECIDRDWDAYLKEAVIKPYLADYYGGMSGRRVVREVRKHAGNSAQSKACYLIDQAAEEHWGHAASWDELYKRLREEPEFISAFDSMIDDVADDKLRSRRGEVERDAIEQLKKRFRKSSLTEYGDISDIVQGATGRYLPLGFGHDIDYFQGIMGDENRATEFFAEACSSKVVNPGSLALMEELFPSAMAEFDELIKELL